MASAFPNATKPQIVTDIYDTLSANIEIFHGQNGYPPRDALSNYSSSTN